MTYQELENKYPLASLEFAVSQANAETPERGDESDEDFWGMIEETLLNNYVKHFGALGIVIAVAPCKPKLNGNTYEGQVSRDSWKRFFSAKNRNEALMHGLMWAFEIREWQLSSPGWKLKNTESKA